MLALVLAVAAAQAAASHAAHAAPHPACKVLTSAQLREPVELADGCYSINSLAEAEAPVTIRPGVTVIFGAGASLIVGQNASLDAEGTEDAPITLRGRDAAPGFWHSLVFRSNSLHNRLRNVIVAGAGSGESEFDAAVQVTAGARLAIEQTTIRGARGIGLFVGQRALLGAFAVNHFEDTGTPVSIKAADMGVMDGATTFVRNRHNYVLVHFHDSNVTEAATWHALAVPYLIEPNMTVTAPITVEHGVELRFTAQTFLEVQGEGALTADGAILTGADEVPGYWAGIAIESNNTANRMTGVVVRFAGEKSGGAVRVAPGARLAIRGSELSFSQGAGILVSRKAVLNPDAGTANRFHDDAVPVAWN